MIQFAHPEPTPSTATVWPAFLPFAGCPYRCLYCAQDKQTGQEEAGLDALFKDTQADLELALHQGRGPYELAFYGGTFTALPWHWQARFLELADRFREAGLVTRVRCSTRPDCVDADGLSRLGERGLDMVELGIQSFDDSALKASSRGYDGRTARRACGLVKASGLGLGIQLLPGLPGDDQGLFRADVDIAAAFAPETARLYPCLVIRGTGLASLWERGGYEPWTLDRAKEELAAALPVFWKKGTRVIRLGLAPEGTLAENVLAGPWHPALGQSVRGLALLEIVREQAAKLDGPAAAFEVPRRYQGELFGHAGELVPAYEALSIPKDIVRYVDHALFGLAT
jgi:histone acetyltransferase (RNA polymerase elongator complex component)